MIFEDVVLSELLVVGEQKRALVSWKRIHYRTGPWTC